MQCVSNVFHKSVVFQCRRRAFHGLPRQPGFEKDVTFLAQFIASRKKLVVITGAGISTDSGIPDYRGPNGSYKYGHKPITYQEFIRIRQVQQRYWARSMKAWPIFATAKPSLSHLTLAQLERDGILKHIITQNVDRLHHKGGSVNIIELHGTLSEVVCLNCEALWPREEIQIELEHKNPMWAAPKFNSSFLRPDGDLELNVTDYASFVLPNCSCDPNHGVIKPNVILFGENCKKSVVDSSLEVINHSDGVLVFASSCMVYSVYRLILTAVERKIPVGIVNMGETRADGIVNFKIQQPIADILGLTYKYLTDYKTLTLQQDNI